MTTDWLTGMDDEQLAELSAYIVGRATECRHASWSAAPGPDRRALLAKARAWRTLHGRLRREAKRV